MIKDSEGVSMMSMNSEGVSMMSRNSVNNYEQWGVSITIMNRLNDY
jgi:hypothetical protein